MSMYYVGELNITDGQLEKIITYLGLIGEDVQACNTREKQQYYLGVLEAFGNDERKAAFTYLKAREKGTKAMFDHAEKLYQCSSIPFPEESNPLKRFHSLEESLAYWRKVKVESIAKSEQVFKKEFDDVVSGYHNQQWNTPQTLQ